MFSIEINKKNQKSPYAGGHEEAMDMGMHTRGRERAKSHGSKKISLKKLFFPTKIIK